MAMNRLELRSRIAEALPSPRVRSARRQPKRDEIRSVVLFGQHPNPTSDYYFSARLTAPGMPPYQFADIRQKQFPDLNPDGALVIICRYMSSAALDWIEASADRLAGVGLFLDDDIPAVIASNESTIRYKFSLLTKAILPLRRLNRQLDMVWASTPRLARTFGEVDVRLMPPAPPRTLWDIPHSGRQKADRAPILLAYHATGIHVQEHEFLRPVIAKVLSERPNAMFEVFAEDLGAYSWSKLARVTVRKPIPWASYVDEGRYRRRMCCTWK